MSERQTVYATIEDLDRALFDDMNAKIPEDLEEVEVEEVVEEVEDTEDELEEEEEPEEKAVEEPEKPVKRTPESKKEYAFDKLRKENVETKRALAEKEAILQDREATVQRLMREAGYEDYVEFKTAMEKELAQKEREEKGWTDKQYAEVESIRKRNKELEEEHNKVSQRVVADKANTFDTHVREFATKYNLGEKGVNTVYGELEKAGYNLEMILAQPKPDVLIKGIMAEYIEQNAVSTHISKKATRKVVDEGRAITTPNGESDKGAQAEEMLKQDLADYRKRFGR